MVVYLSLVLSKLGRLDEVVQTLNEFDDLFVRLVVNDSVGKVPDGTDYLVLANGSNC